MCSMLNRRRKFWLRPFFLYTVMLVLGIVSGCSNNAELHAFAAFIADVFIKIFKCISLPIIGLSIIVTISQNEAAKEMKNLSLPKSLEREVEVITSVENILTDSISEISQAQVNSDPASSNPNN